MPFWRSLQRTLAQADTHITSLNDRATHIDAQMDKYQEIVRQTNRAEHVLTISALTQVTELLFEGTRCVGVKALVGAKESGVKVLISMDPNLPQVEVDRVQVQQVLLNLIRNAMESMEHSPVRELAVAASMHDGHVLIEVSDTGIGIAQEIADKLFQPFVTTKPDGMGIGLAISRTIIEAHGGRLWAESNPNGGSVFRFTLPAI